MPTPPTPPPGAYTKFMGRWGWPIMGFFAAAPILAHALDWRNRVEVKKRLEDEKKRQLSRQVDQVQSIAPTADDVYKVAAFARTLEGIPKCSVIEKLDLLDKAIRSRKQNG